MASDIPGLSKSKVDPRQYGSCRFGYLMLPPGIGVSGHQQKGAVMQRDFNWWDTFEHFMAQAEHTGFTKGDRSNIHVFIARGSPITVPSHAVSAVPVKVQQNGIKTDAGFELYTLPDKQQLSGPVGIGLALRPVGVPLPSNHSRGGDYLVIHRHLVLAPLGGVK